MIKLVVGLGNPGQKYLKTRHNVGFLLLDELISSEVAFFSSCARFHGEFAELGHAGHKLYLLKPNTYMNRSGQSVLAVMKYYKLGIEEVLVVHDDLDFDPGVFRLKSGGGHGGHNGLRDIIAVTGKKEFLRLRVGIGRPNGVKAVADYVLSDFSKTDLELVMIGFSRFKPLLPMLLSGSSDLAMQQLHSK